MNMEQLKEKLIKKAKQSHKSIFPVGEKKSFEDCFQQYDNKMAFWYNTEDQNTHVVIGDVKVLKKQAAQKER